jgi:hypothetical protein
MGDVVQMHPYLEEYLQNMDKQELIEKMLYEMNVLNMFLEDRTLLDDYVKFKEAYEKSRT